MTEPPEALFTKLNVNPVPLPPVATSVTVPRGATIGAAGDRITPAPTVTFAVALLPSASVAVTTSVTDGVAPAV